MTRRTRHARLVFLEDRRLASPAPASVDALRAEWLHTDAPAADRATLAMLEDRADAGQPITDADLLEHIAPILSRFRQWCADHRPDPNPRAGAADPHDHPAG